MRYLPCRKCPQCGLYHDFTVEVCECGQKLKTIEAKFINTRMISRDELGEIDTTLKAYVQKCSACGALNYTNNLSNPVKVCYNCHKTRIASISPIECVEEYGENTQMISTAKDEVTDGGRGFDEQQTIIQVAQDQSSFDTFDDDDDDYDDERVRKWSNILLENIQKNAGTAPVAQASQTYTQQDVECNTPKIVNSIDADDDDDDEDEVCDWTGIVGTEKDKNSTLASNRNIPQAPANNDITLTAIGYGRLSFTIAAGTDKYMLGRSANQASFLSQDKRVSNEHCYLYCKNRTWFVRDNHSGNGTAVNSHDIGENGERSLSDGDELKLGHHSDSVAFLISIK